MPKDFSIITCPECDGDGTITVFSGMGKESGFGYVQDERSEDCDRCEGSGDAEATVEELAQELAMLDLKYQMLVKRLKR